MNTLNKTPVTIITGFLGSGKTTLIQKLIAQTSPPTRYAIIINEFGEIDIDAQTISEQTSSKKNCTIQEMPNGCICCTIEEDFIPTIQSLIKRIDEIDHIIIETSGLALPKPLVEAFLWPEINRHLTVDATLCLIDAQALEQKNLTLPKKPNPQFTLKHTQPTQELLNDQLICADLIILNKIENLSENTLNDLIKQIKPLIQPNSKILKQAKHSHNANELIKQNLNAQDYIQNIHTHHDLKHQHNQDHTHAHETFKHYMIDTNQTQHETLNTLIKQLINLPSIYRIKGYAAIEKKTMRLCVQATGNSFSSYFDKTYTHPDERKTQLVIIGEHNQKDEKTIQNLIDQFHASSQC